MVILLVGAHDKILHVHQGIVGKDPALDADGPGKPARRLRDLQNHVIHGQFQFIAAKEIFHFNFINFFVAPDQDCYRFAVGVENQCLDHILRCHLQKSANLLNRSDIGRVDLLQRKEVLCVSLFLFRPGNLRLFKVRRVITSGTINHGIFTGIGRDEKFMGEAATDAARVRLNRPEFKATAREDPVVGIKHLPVTDFRTFLVRVKTVGILHAEFTAAHGAEAGTNFVAEFCLDLIKIQGKLTVGLDFVANQIGNDLFVRGAETTFPVMTVAESQQFLAVMGPASRFLPEFRRLYGGKENLLCAGAGHFLADDLLKLPNHTITQRKIGINPAGQFSDHASPQHELVADHLCIGRSFSHRRQKHH